LPATTLLVKPPLTMNDIQTANKELITQVLKEILTEEPSLNTKCFCHVIDATKTRILA
jgi:hypothetical protein